MLDTLRSAAQTWTAKVLLGILVISFAVWGIADVFRGGTGSNDVLASGRSKATITDYQIAYDRQVNYYSQQYGQRLTREQAKGLGIDNQVLAQLVAGVVLDEEARHMQLGLSEDRLARLTADDPAFHGPDGQFNRQIFTEVLRQAGLRPKDYFRNRKKVAVRQQIVEAATDGMNIPDTMVKALALYQGESRTIDLVTLAPSIVGDIADPDEKTLTAYFEANKAKYRAPEYRKITYVTLRPQDVADPASISDQQVKEAYDKEKSRFTTPEKRTIEQLSFANEADAKAAADKIGSGAATFEDIAKSQGKSDADITLGTYEKSALPDKKIADAAFSLRQGEVSGVIKGAFGPVLLRVTQITPQSVSPLETVAAKIRQDLALRQASSALLDIHDAYEDARAGGATIPEAAAKEKLKATTIEVDANGQAPGGQDLKDIPDQEKFLQAAFASEVGADNDSISLQPSGFLWYDVDSVTRAHDRTLAEVHDRVVADWKTDERAKRLAAKADEMEKKVSDGGSLQALATELGLQMQTKRGVKRTTNDGDLGPAAVEQVFDGAAGHAGVADASSGGGKIVFKVTDVEEPASTGPDSISPEIRKAFAAHLTDDLLDQLVADLQTRYPVTINRSAIDRARTY